MPGKMGPSVLRTGVLLMIVVLFLLPVLVTIINSLMTEREIMANYGMLGEQDAAAAVNLKWIPDRVSFEQYAQVLVTSPTYLRLFWNSVALVVPIVAGQTAVALLASFALGALRFRGREAVFMMYLFTMLLPFQVTLVPNYLMAERLGLLGSHSSIVLPGIFGAFGVFLLRQYMLLIPSAYIEAAKMDGAGYGRIFFSVVLPMVKPGIAALMVLLFTDHWNMVEQPLIFLQDAALQPLSLFLSRIRQGMLGVSFAASVVYMVPAVLLFLSAEEHFIEGIELSGIKG